MLIFGGTRTNIFENRVCMNSRANAEEEDRDAAQDEESRKDGDEFHAVK